VKSTSHLCFLVHWDDDSLLWAATENTAATKSKIQLEFCLSATHAGPHQNACYSAFAVFQCVCACVCVCVRVWESNSTLKSEFQNSKFEQDRISHRVTGCSGETGSNLGNVTEYHMVSVVTLCCHLEGLWWLTPRSGPRQLRYRFITLQLTWTHLCWSYVITAFERLALNKVQPTRTL
jgi:hypothetical protein